VTPPPTVLIHYLRPPDRKEIFRQRLVLDKREVKVTLAQNVPFDPPIRIHGNVVLEAGSDAVWFTFPGLWHDIGRFHRADGSFTGIYANILTPPVMGGDHTWHTTDLFLDIWIDPRGRLEILDGDQLEEALDRGWVSSETARRAWEEARWIECRFNEGTWPPPVVREWTLTRARVALASPRE
jgi:predicted RNA-binding protein associated with RNAse of E/G family